jgi:hypothetical protein
LTILFIHPQKAFLPEITAYADFFSAYGIETRTALPSARGREKADVEWHFMGLDPWPVRRVSALIHEYASGSLAPMRRIKDRIKKVVNRRPDYRLFLNEYVREQFGFSNQIPWGFRDMGLPSALIRDPGKSPLQKKYDFIYCGSVRPDRQLENLFMAFARPPLQEKTLLILSRDYSFYARKYSAYPNIIFQGPVSPQEVPGYIKQARFCINYRPNLQPHSHQTPAKLLEYAACRIPILSSDFYWVRDFCKTYGGRFFYLKPDLSNLSWEKISAFSYSFPQLQDWSWDHQIRKSGVLEFLESRFPGLHF